MGHSKNNSQRTKFTLTAQPPSAATILLPERGWPQLPAAAKVYSPKDSIAQDIRHYKDYMARRGDLEPFIESCRNGNSGLPPRARAWVAFIDKVRPIENKLLKLSLTRGFVNGMIEYDRDKANWGDTKHWISTPQTTLEKGLGVCVDTAVLMRETLIRIGFPQEDVHYFGVISSTNHGSVVREDRLGGLHAAIKVSVSPEQTFILDNGPSNKFLAGDEALSVTTRVKRFSDISSITPWGIRRSAEHDEFAFCRLTPQIKITEVGGKLLPVTTYEGVQPVERGRHTLYYLHDYAMKHSFYSSDRNSPFILDGRCLVDPRDGYMLPAHGLLINKIMHAAYDLNSRMDPSRVDVDAAATLYDGVSRRYAPKRASAVREPASS